MIGKQELSVYLYICQFIPKSGIASTDEFWSFGIWKEWESFLSKYSDLVQEGEKGRVFAGKES